MNIQVLRETVISLLFKAQRRIWPTDYGAFDRWKFVLTGEVPIFFAGVSEPSGYMGDHSQRAALFSLVPPSEPVFMTELLVTCSEAMLVRALEGEEVSRYAKTGTAMNVVELLEFVSTSAESATFRRTGITASFPVIV